MHKSKKRKGLSILIFSPKCFAEKDHKSQRQNFGTKQRSLQSLVFFYVCLYAHSLSFFFIATMHGACIYNTIIMELHECLSKWLFLKSKVEKPFGFLFSGPGQAGHSYHCCWTITVIVRAAGEWSECV